MCYFVSLAIFFFFLMVVQIDEKLCKYEIVFKISGFGLYATAFMSFCWLLATVVTTVTSSFASGDGNIGRFCIICLVCLGLPSIIFLVETHYVKIKIIEKCLKLLIGDQTSQSIDVQYFLQIHGKIAAIILIGIICFVCQARKMRKQLHQEINLRTSSICNICDMRTRLAGSQ
jgi:hypothetical protein